MTSKTLRTLRGRSLSAVAGAGIALGVLGLLFGAASLSHAAVDSVARGTEAKPNKPAHKRSYPDALDNRNLVFVTRGGTRTIDFTVAARTDR